MNANVDLLNTSVLDKGCSYKVCIKQINSYELIIFFYGRVCICINGMCV